MITLNGTIVKKRGLTGWRTQAVSFKQTLVELNLELQTLLMYPIFHTYSLVWLETHWTSSPLVACVCTQWTDIPGAKPWAGPQQLSCPRRSSFLECCLKLIIAVIVARTVLSLMVEMMGKTTQIIMCDVCKVSFCTKKSDSGFTEQMIPERIICLSAEAARERKRRLAAAVTRRSNPPPLLIRME